VNAAAVGFDFDHTLGIDNKLERTVGIELLVRQARKASCSVDKREAAQATDAALGAYRSTRITLEDALRAAFARFARRGIDCEAVVTDFRATVLARAPAFVKPLPGALRLLRELDRVGIPYALLTNGWSPLQEEKARLIGFRGAVFVGETIDVRKPSPGAFERLIRYFGELPEKIWYVGDDPVADVAGSQAAGLRSVWFDWEKRAYPEGQGPPAHRIHALRELSDVLTNSANTSRFR
jgi:FMN phosphatase YigB (HAD superfamily)